MRTRLDSSRSLAFALALVLPGATIAATGCSSELDNKPSAKVADKKGDKKADAKADKKADAKADKKADAKAPPAAPAAKPAPEGSLAVDATGSKIEFVGAKMVGDHTGQFPKFTGWATLDGDTPKGVGFSVDVQSLTSDAEGLTKHLLSDDFFDAAKFPVATFESSEIKAEKGDGHTHQVSGDLTIRGITKTVTFPATITVAGDKVTGASEFKINRKDWGIVYAGKPDNLIKDDVLLKLNLVFPKKA